jgi:hypothetical protein
MTSVARHKPQEVKIVPDFSLVPAGLETLQKIYDAATEAYAGSRRRRVETFVRAIGAVSDELTDAERERFERYMNSPVAHELLADLVEQASRTRSTIAIAALAILFSDPVEERFSSEDKAEAATRSTAFRTTAGHLWLWFDRLLSDKHVDTSHCELIAAVRLQEWLHAFGFESLLEILEAWCQVAPSLLGESESWADHFVRQETIRVPAGLL